MAVCRGVRCAGLWRLAGIEQPERQDGLRRWIDGEGAAGIGEVADDLPSELASAVIGHGPSLAPPRPHRP